MKSRYTIAEWQGRCKSCASKVIAAIPEVKRRVSESARAQVIRQGGIPNRRTFKKGEHLGADHPFWKGGTIDKRDGYRKIHINGKQVFEHRHVMEQSLGRMLTNDEVCHHINGDKLDNRIENLQLMTRAEHLLHHGIPAKGVAARRAA